MTYSWINILGLLLCAAAVGYSVIAFVAVRSRIRPVSRLPLDLPAVTLLKPLCGAEPETYECLRSFCLQDYPHYQVIFGVSDADDPVIEIVRRLQREFPDRGLQLTVERALHGTSRKVSNLINMMPLVRHEYLVLSDSDVRVPADYLVNVVAPLLDPSVGIVTCAYRGLPRLGVWSLLGAMYINEWFVPSVRVAAMAGSRAFAFGATIALRRGVLAAIGGFLPIVNQLADDYRLGEMTRGVGLRTVLSHVYVDTYVNRRTLHDLIRHELRWLRTIRAVRPMGYRLSFVTFSLPVAIAGAWLAAGSPLCLAAIGVTALCRVVIHLTTRTERGRAPRVALLAVRDMLTLTLWGWSFVSRRVQWRGDSFWITPDGTAQRFMET
jgi:ceramide glucosyltransferase